METQHKYSRHHEYKLRRSLKNLPERARSRRRILVIDDDRDLADSLAKLLQITGHEIQTGYDGQEAVAMAESFRPEIVLLDIELPKRNGHDACRQIRAQPWGREITLIALTGRDGEEDRSRSKEAGFDHHMVKPLDYGVLAALLAR
jgi:DNA-binding response OmpR family regulator